MLTYFALGEEGRLGNQLWQIASTIGLADRMGLDVSFPSWSYEPWLSLPSWLFRGAKGVDSTEYAFDSPPNVRPYLQNLKYWSHCQDLIRKFFQPSRAAVEVVEETFADVLGDGAAGFTAVHVRRTDAVVKQQWFRVPAMEYFEPAMKVVSGEDPETTFLVFSDDVKWCRENFPLDVGGCPIRFVTPDLPEPARNYRGDPQGNDRDWQEFFLMAKYCRHHITANSTFSWWAAWLSENPSPITPAVWYGPMHSNIDIDAFLPPHWRRM